MNITNNINFRLVLVNIMVIIVIFVISYIFLHQLNKIENVAINKLVIVNDRQNVLEKLQNQVLQLKLDATTLLLEQSDAAQLKILQRLKLLDLEVAKAKAIGGINSLELNKLTNSFDDFSRNNTKIFQLFYEIKQINTEVLAPQLDKADLLISELENSLFNRSKFLLAKSFSDIHQLITDVKYSFVVFDKSLGVVKSNENTNNKRKLNSLINKIKLMDMNSQERSIFYSLQSFLTSYNDSVMMLNKRIAEKEVVQRKIFQLQLKTQQNIIDKLIVQMNMRVAEYSLIHKQDLANTRIIIWILASLAIVFSAIVGWYLRNRMIRPVSDLVKLSKLLAESNFKQLLKLTKHSYTNLMGSQDQFGEIARAFEASAKYQQRMIFDIDTACQGLTLGFLNQHTSFDYQGEYKLVERTLNSSKENIKSLVEDIIATSEAIAVGELDSKINSSLYLGDFKPISESMDVLTTNLQKQLEDILAVTQSLEFGLEDKKRFITPTSSYQGEFLKIQNSLEHAVQSLSASAQQNLDQDWLKSGLSDMNRELTGEQPLEVLTKNSIDFIADYFNAPMGYIYRTFEDKRIGTAIRMIAHYGILMDDETKATRYKFVYPEGVGLIGQVFVTPEIIIKKLNDEERVPVSQSSIATAIINYVVVLPLIHEEKIEGVLELGLYEPPTAIQKEFLLQVINNLGIAMNVAVSRGKINQLLAQSQRQAEELEAQQSQLGQSNEMLHLKAKELEEKQQAVEQKNSQLEQASKVMEEKAKELILASKYKSEFLANMSHELRSPLNSLLILSKLLIDNSKNHLDEKEVTYAEVIHRSGTDLLQLIEDILDLSKIEAGKTDIFYRPIETTEIVDHISQRFTEIAKKKQLNFILTYDKAPKVVDVDKQRLLQIMTNLLSNAFKFTEQGEINLTIEAVNHEHDVEDTNGVIQKVNGDILRLSITDTGIGIDEEKQCRIFQAFQQADGTTSRKYGGTGLGLSITLQLVELMDGFIQVDSELCKGSQFSVYLPLREIDSNINLIKQLPDDLIGNGKVNTGASKSAAHSINVNSTVLPIDFYQNSSANEDSPKQATILVFEDVNSAEIVNKVVEKGFKALVENNINTVVSAAKMSKTKGIILCVTKSDANLKQLQKALHADLETKNIPILVLVTDPSLNLNNGPLLDQYLSEIETELSLSQNDIMQNYFEFSEILANKLVLIVDDNISNVFALSAILEQNKMKYVIAANGVEAIDIIQQHSEIDLILMDIMMPELDGYKTMSAIRDKSEYIDTPIIALTAKAMPEDRNKCIMAGANDYMTKPIDAQKLVALMKMWVVTTPNRSKLIEIN